MPKYVGKPNVAVHKRRVVAMEVTESLEAAPHSSLDFCISGQNRLAVSQLGHGHLVDGFKCGAVFGHVAHYLVNQATGFQIRTTYYERRMLSFSAPLA